MEESISRALGFTDQEIREMLAWEKQQHLRLQHLPEDMSSGLKNRLRLGIPAAA